MQGLYTRHLSEKGNSDWIILFEETLSFLVTLFDRKSQESVILFCFFDFEYFAQMIILYAFESFSCIQSAI